MTKTFCLGCKSWFDKRSSACPGCGRPRFAVNVALESERFKRNLNWQADHARRN